MRAINVNEPSLEVKARALRLLLEIHRKREVMLCREPEAAYAAPIALGGLSGDRGHGVGLSASGEAEPSGGWGMAQAS